MSDIIEEFKKFLRFCPICGNELEIHPFRNVPCCYNHGDFVVKEDAHSRNNLRVTFELMPIENMAKLSSGSPSYMPTNRWKIEDAHGDIVLETDCEDVIRKDAGPKDKVYQLFKKPGRLEWRKVS